MKDNHQVLAWCRGLHGHRVSWRDLLHLVHWQARGHRLLCRQHPLRSKSCSLPHPDMEHVETEVWQEPGHGGKEDHSHEAHLHETQRHEGENHRGLRRRDVLLLPPGGPWLCLLPGLRLVREDPGGLHGHQPLEQQLRWSLCLPNFDYEFLENINQLLILHLGQGCKLKMSDDEWCWLSPPHESGDHLSPGPGWHQGSAPGLWSLTPGAEVTMMGTQSLLWGAIYSRIYFHRN